MTIAGFAAGFIAMALVRRLSALSEKGKNIKRGIPWAIVTGIAVDILIDGFLLGIGFAAGNAEGTLLAIALSIEFLSLGIATAAALTDTGIKTKMSFKLIGGLAVIFLTSALLGSSLLQYAPHNIMDLVLSFGLSALLFLVTEELLKEAHEEKESVSTTASFFAGFLLFLILGMYI